MGYYNMPPGNTFTELSDFEKLLRSLPLEAAIEALDLLETLSRNVIQHPSEEKYRRVRATNEKLAPLFGTPGINDVMAEMGWQRDGDFMVLPKEVRLDFPKHIVPMLEAKSHFGKQREKAKKAARMEQDPNKAGLLQQLEIDRRERVAAQSSKAAPPVAAAKVAQAAPPVAAAKAQAAYPTAAAKPTAPPAVVEVPKATAPPPAPSITTPDMKDKVAQIEAMGFNSTDAQAALLAHDGDVERSIEALCDGWTADKVPATVTVAAPAAVSDSRAAAPMAVATAVPVAAASAATTTATQMATVDDFIGGAQNQGPAPQAKAAAPKSAANFERREDREQKRKEADMSLQELRALRKEQYKEFKEDPNGSKSEAYQRPASTTNGSSEAGWFDWMWGGSSSNSNDSNGRGGGGGARPATGPRMKTINDLPKPCRPSGG